MRAEKPSTELELAARPAENHALETTGSPQDMLAVIAQAARDPNVSVDKMERLYAMAQQERALIAREAFNTAMRECQAEMPVIFKDAKNSSTSSLYVRLETMKRICTPIITKHGFSLRFSQGEGAPAGQIRVQCQVSRGTHEEKHFLDLAIDDVGAKGNPSKTKIHGQGSTFSYGERYLTKLIFNITIAGEDDDGNKGNQPKPQGPSTTAPDSASVKELAAEVWRLLAPKAQGDKTWQSRNQHAWDENLISDTEAFPNLTAARYREVIEKIKAKLQ